MVMAHEVMTAADLLHMPSDGKRYELVRGELLSMSPASPEHGRIAGRVHGLLWSHVEAHQLGDVYAAETGFELSQSPDTVRAPDVAFVSKERAEKIEHGYFPGAPDLAVEVISPEDRYAQVDSKIDDWLEAGCRMVVVVNPRPRHRTVTLYRLSGEVTTLTLDDQLDGSDVVPGWVVPVRRIFGE
jgi:Uma2 family endonuclease